MKLLTLAEISRRLGVSPRTMKKMAGELPGRVLINGRPRYREDGLAAFLEAGGTVPRINQ